MKAKGSERRQSRRYPMRLKVESDRGTGWTADASAGGLFFVFPAAMEAGSEFAFSMVLPGGRGEQRLQCRARVIRTEPSGDGVGVAAELVAWEFDEAAVDAASGQESG